MMDFDTLVTGPCMAAFAEAVVYTAPGRLPVAISGVFDRHYAPLLPRGGSDGQEGEALGGEGALTERRPALGVRLSQFPHPPVQGASVRILGTGMLFEVKEVREDGLGAATLMLAAIG